MNVFVGRACGRMLLSSYHLAERVNKLNTYLGLLLVCDNPFLHLQLFQRTLLWTASSVYLHIKGTVLFQSWLIDFKAAHFGTLPTHFLGCKATELFTQMICKLHGFPKNIISDRDPIFISKICQTCSNSVELNQHEYCLPPPN